MRVFPCEKTASYTVRSTEFLELSLIVSMDASKDSNAKEMLAPCTTNWMMISSRF